MGKLNKGFKLFNPWANEVVEGRLKYLVRSFRTKNRDRVAVIASKGIDYKWLETNPTKKEIDKIFDRFGIVGSVEIKDVLDVEPWKIKKKLIELGGKKYWDYYPKHLIPVKTPYIHVWVLKDSKKWNEIKEPKSRGILWVDIEIDDE
jgi:hypothetical protein